MQRALAPFRRCPSTVSHHRHDMQLHPQLGADGFAVLEVLLPRALTPAKVHVAHGTSPAPHPGTCTRPPAPPARGLTRSSGSPPETIFASRMPPHRAPLPASKVMATRRHTDLCKRPVLRHCGPILPWRERATQSCPLHPRGGRRSGAARVAARCWQAAARGPKLRLKGPHPPPHRRSPLRVTPACNGAEENARLSSSHSRRTRAGSASSVQESRSAPAFPKAARLAKDRYRPSSLP